MSPRFRRRPDAQGRRTRRWPLFPPGTPYPTPSVRFFFIPALGKGVLADRDGTEYASILPDPRGWFVVMRDGFRLFGSFATVVQAAAQGQQYLRDAARHGKKV